MIKVILMALVAAAALPARAQTQASSFPAAPVAGHWVSDVSMASTNKQAPASDYWWVGRMWGRIDPTGKMEFRAANGCTLSGLLSERDYAGLRGTAEVSNCESTTMNRRYAIKARGGATDGKGGDMRITFEAERYANGLRDKWKVEGAFVRYQPK